MNAPAFRFLAAEEKIVTPYKFGVYDLLVLPPSFPYGGMVRAASLIHEPRVTKTAGKCLPVVFDAKYATFVLCSVDLTQLIALLTGDRTLVDVVVHELTHSWFGNGVT